MNKLKVKVTTLGCKANQCDSFFIQNYLKDNNFEVVLDKSMADICIINTCTVTGKSDFQSRQEIRRAVRRNPGAKIFVTGCYAVTGRDELESINGITDVIPPGGISDFLEKLVRSEAMVRSNIAEQPSTSCCNASRRREPSPFIKGDAKSGAFNFVEHFPGRTRAFFKIQDGCNFRCTYCIVPFARGNSRSLPLHEVISGLKRYAELGYKEVVLTGVHLGSYGLDLTPRTSLVALLEEIAAKLSGLRIRISSLDPHEVTESIIDIVSNSPIFCRHFHIPLQSGDNKILKMMCRNYSRDNFVGVVKKIKNKISYAGIGIDVIAGFPGEGDEEFKNTYNFINSLPVSYLHVFPFSVRKGTPAEKLQMRIHGKIIRERTESLIGLGREKRRKFYESFKGKTAKVLVEGRKRGDYYYGFTDNYLPVLIKGKHIAQGQLIDVKIERSEDLKLIASISDRNE